MALKRNGWTYFDTAANLAADNATPGAGDVYVASDTGAIKVGDGSTAYNSLAAHGLVGGLTASLANRTRSLFLPAQTLVRNDTGTGASLGTSPDLVDIIRLDDAVTDRVYGLFQVPLDWATSTVTLRMHFSMAATDASSPPEVRLEVGHKQVTGGEPDAAATVITAAAYTVTSTVNMQTLDFTLFTPSAAGVLGKFYIERTAGNAADTYEQNMRLLGVEIRYTADS